MPDTHTLRSRVIRLAHARPELRSVLLPVLGRSVVARGFYSDLPLDLTGIQWHVTHQFWGLREESRLADEKSRAIKRAWDNRDIEELVRLGVLTEHDLELLRAAYEAQQEGREDDMYEELSKVAPPRRR